MTRNQQICDLYAQGKSGRAIAPLVGISFQRVYGILKTYGVAPHYVRRPRKPRAAPRPYSPPPPRVRVIAEEIASRVGVPIEEVVAGGRNPRLVAARDEAMARAYDLMKGDRRAFSHTRIGQMFGNRTSAAVARAIQRHHARQVELQEAA